MKTILAVVGIVLLLIALSVAADRHGAQVEAQRQFNGLVGGAMARSRYRRYQVRAAISTLTALVILGFIAWVALTNYMAQGR